MDKHYIINKPEVHKVLHCRQKRAEPQSQVICAENFVKFGHVIFEISERRVMHTDTLTAILQLEVLYCEWTVHTSAKARLIPVPPSGESV